MTRQEFENFVTSCQEGLRRFLTALCCGDRALAEDIAQDSFMKAYLSCNDIHDTSRFKAWVFRIAYNTFISAQRSRHVFEPEEKAASHRSDVRSDDAFKYEALYSALARLSDKERTSVLLFYLQGYSIQEIADTVGASQDAIKQQLNRGRKHLKDLIDERR